jgi:hypothetical protein
MSSYDKVIILDLGLSSSPTPSVETSTLGMDNTTNIPLSRMEVNVFSRIPQENIIQIHKGLAKLQ